jgi:1-aminocyclopropane-1-carboxylate deaminase/D-cysteine desulfhydrase-like pyridoxal-dependent ACC family enzyme
VYSGKAAAGMIAMIRRGDVPPAERVLFVHTGGTPGLFAYGDAVLSS